VAEPRVHRVRGLAQRRDQRRAIARAVEQREQPADDLVVELHRVVAEVGHGLAALELDASHRAGDRVLAGRRREPRGMHVQLDRAGARARPEEVPQGLVAGLRAHPCRQLVECQRARGRIVERIQHGLEERFVPLRGLRRRGVGVPDM
jgi:hypothetical protein